MKKFLLLTVAALALGVSARAADGDEFTFDNLNYRVISETGHTAEVCGHANNAEGDLVIPSQVTNGSSDYSVTTIGDVAFYWCSGLTAVTIPNSVTTIGDFAFCYCEGLTSVTIPNSVTTIGGEAFCGCYGLTSVTIPASVSEIGTASFSNCQSLTEILVEEGNANYISVNGVLFTKDMHGILAFPAGRSGEYEIPSSVTTIEGWVFSGCRGLTSVTIPNSVTTIGDRAFENCAGLTSVTIGNSVTTIGNYAFSGCSMLTIIYSLSEVPPSTGYNTFGENGWGPVPEDAVVFVPKGTVEVYSAAEGWNRFHDFREMDDPTGIEGIDADGDGVPAEFYDLNGLRVSGDAPGIYIRRQGGRTAKVLVR